MTIYTATGVVYGNPQNANPGWTADASGFDGDFGTSASFNFATTNDSNTIGASAIASFGVDADAEPFRVAKCRWSMIVSGVSASRRGRITYYFSTGGSFGPPGGLTATTDQGAEATWFGVNANFGGTISVAVPAGVSGAVFKLMVVLESPGDNRGIINNRNCDFDIYEFYIDSSPLTGARMMAMLIPSTI